MKYGLLILSLIFCVSCGVSEPSVESEGTYAFSPDDKWQASIDSYEQDKISYVKIQLLNLIKYPQIKDGFYDASSIIPDVKLIFPFDADGRADSTEVTWSNDSNIFYVKFKSLPSGNIHNFAYDIKTSLYSLK